MFGPIYITKNGLRTNILNRKELKKEIAPYKSVICQNRFRLSQNESGCEAMHGCAMLYMNHSSVAVQGSARLCLFRK
jgi:hypothetical protein